MCSKRNIVALKEKIDRPTFDCSSIPALQGMNSGYDFAMNNKIFTNPYFNPNNGDEFVFMKENIGNSYNYIYTYNLKTKQKILIHEGYTHRNLEWTTNDWIIFNSIELHKIKSNGDSLSIISKIKYHFTTEKDKILYKKPKSTPSKFMFYFADLNNVIFDSVNTVNTVVQPEWYKDKVIFMPHIIYNLKTKEIKKILHDTDLNFISQQKWVNDDEFIWGDRKSIYKTNVLTNNTDTILSHCNGFGYVSFDYSPHTNKIICNLVRKEVVAHSLLKMNVQIVMMNLDGTEKEFIDIDNEFKD